MENIIGAARNQHNPSGDTSRIKSIHAYIFVQTRVGNLSQVLENAKNIKYVTSAAAVSGNDEIIVKARVQTLDQLKKMTDKLHRIDGVQQTMTRIVEKEVFP